VCFNSFLSKTKIERRRSFKNLRTLCAVCVRSHALRNWFIL